MDRNDIIGISAGAIVGLLLAFWFASDVHEVDRYILALKIGAWSGW